MAESARWVCDVCGYEHEGPEPPAECPICGVGPDEFSRVPAAAPAPASVPAAAPAPASVPAAAPAVAAGPVAGGEPAAPPQDAAPASAPPAPSGADPAASAPAAAPKRWVCAVCGYEHEGPEPPEVCPVCGVGPEEFSEVLAPVAAQDPAPAGEARPVVIVGGGVAGFSAAEAARSASALAEIHLVCGEGVLPYNRVALTRLLAGQVNAELLLLKDEAWYAAQRITLHRVQAVEIDRVARAVILEGGLRLAYHKLVLATGATSFVPPILGAEGPAVYTLRTLQDAQAILAAASPGARGVVIGGGLLGLETAGGLAARGVRMTVVEGAPFLLSRQLTRGLAGLLERHIRDLGIEVLTDAKIQAIEREPLGVRLGGGRLLPADFVVISTGVRPDLALAQGLEQGRGLRVDDRMSTSDPSVLAAGDLVEHRGVVAGLWTVAQAQGAAAGRFAVDPAAPAFTPPPIATRLKVLDLPVFSGGDFAAEAEGSMALTTATGQTTARLVVSAGVLIGAVVIGDEALGGLAWRALQTGGPLAAQQPLLDAVPGLREWLATL